ncbi:hypothetical protein DL96DRAFT_1685420 [Flagelloscypha sp. PMI_526]|nr:hypothetical protein DL96DRAFT_1685420 [Flagelloscypha sp. PMI_526]
MLYEQSVMRLVGPHLTSIDLSWPHLSQHGPPGWDSDAFHLSALPSLENFKINTTSEFCREIDAPLQWVLPRFSVGTCVNHPLSMFCIAFYAGQPPTQVISQASSNLVLQLDNALSSFQHLTKVWLLGKLGIATLETMDVWKQQQVSLRSLFPSMAKRNNVLDFDHGSTPRAIKNRDS